MQRHPLVVAEHVTLDVKALHTAQIQVRAHFGPDIIPGAADALTEVPPEWPENVAKALEFAVALEPRTAHSFVAGVLLVVLTDTPAVGLPPHNARVVPLPAAGVLGDYLAHIRSHGCPPYLVLIIHLLICCIHVEVLP